MNDETKIVKCPYCGLEPSRRQHGERGLDGVVCDSDPYNRAECPLYCHWFEIDTWNALCADIEKGRECEEVKERIRVLEKLSKVEKGYSRNLERGCRVWKEKHDVLEAHLETAVTLLGLTRKRLYDKVMLQRQVRCAARGNICIQGKDADPDYPEYTEGTIFLADPAIKKIIDAQKGK